MKQAGKTVLVTGGCGYVGSILVGDLLAQGYSIRIIDLQWFGNYLSDHPQLQVRAGDIRDIHESELKGLDAIIHLANVANDPGVELDPTLSWEINGLGSQQLADKAVRAGVPHFIYASSGSVYGVKSEPNVTEDLPLDPISVYNKTKMVAERAILSYGDEMTVHCVRPATVCGYSPRMRLDVSVNILTMQAFKNGKMTVFGGAQVRPNIHIDDMSRVYSHFLKNADLPSGSYNAGFENISILDIAEIIASKVKSEIVVSESNDPRSYRQNSDKLLASGFAPSKTVSIAVDEMLEKWSDGTLSDNENWSTVRKMKSLGIGK